MNNMLANNLKKLRETAFYTQEQVSQALGVSRSAYSNYESGEREVPYDILEKRQIYSDVICMCYLRRMLMQ